MKSPQSPRGIEPLRTLLLRAYGRTIELEGPEATLATARERLPPNYRIASAPAERRWEVREHPGGGWAATTDGQLVSFLPTILQATDVALSDLELWVAERARKRIFVHAGCVAVDGHAIVLPGRSITGKSHLTAALVRAGADYFSDEYAVLDSTGLVRPYPRKLAMRPEQGGAARHVGLEELGGRVGRGAATVKLIAVLRYDSNAGWQPETLTRGQGALRLFDNTVAARTRPRAALTALEGATEGAQVLEGTRGDADEAAAHLLSILTA